MTTYQLHSTKTFEGSQRFILASVHRPYENLRETSPWTAGVLSITSRAHRLNLRPVERLHCGPVICAQRRRRSPSPVTDITSNCPFVAASA